MPIYWSLREVYCGLSKIQLCYKLHINWFTLDWDGWKETEKVHQKLELQPECV